MSFSLADIKATAKRPQSRSLLLRQSLAGKPVEKIRAFTSRAENRRRRSKSATSYSEEVTRAKRRLKKAWNPVAMYSLSSRSSHLLSDANPSSQWDPDGTMDSISAMKRLEFGRAEDHIALDDLIKLRKKFQDADVDGNGTLDMNEFVSTFNDLFHLEGKNEEEITMFFNKIDFNCDGCIDWDEFCTYMYLEYQEREDAKNIIINVEFQLPAETLKVSPHRDSICSIQNISDGSLVSCSQDGVVCLWGQDNRPKRIKRAESGLTGKPKWVTDMALCLPQNKILLTTGEHEIQFYEMMNFEPYCQLRRLESVPLKLHFWYNPSRTDECCILIGDKEGTVTVLAMDNIQEAFKHWKLAVKMDNGMPTYSLDRLAADRIAGTNFYRWKLHTNWVTEVQYFGKLRCFASCSCDPVNSIVLGSPAGSTPVDALLQGSVRMNSSDDKDNFAHESVNTVGKRRMLLTAKCRHVDDQRIFSVSKGVTTIKYGPKNNLMVTGGLDQIIRIWNPFITGKPVAHLYGQGSPVFGLQIDSLEEKIYSIGNDNTIKMWNLVDHSCMLTLIPSAHKITSPVEYFYFNPVHNYLAVASDHLSLLRTMSGKGGRSDIVQTHLHPITAVRYSHCFNQIVTSCEGAMLKVWDIYSGKKMFEFSANLGDDTIISAMDVDRSGKRIVTGGDNGLIKVWNYNNGQCVRVLDKGTDKETSDIKFITLNDNQYIIAVGWDRELYLFPDMVSRHMEHCVKPISDWSKASSKVHCEDILCIAVGHPNLMATSSYDGEIVLWSVISCHMLAKLIVPKKVTSTFAAQEDWAINKILFLDKRSDSVKTSGTLVSSGPDGKIHFWNVYHTRAPMGFFHVQKNKTVVTDMAVNESNHVLAAADSDGNVSIFEITYYCLNALSKPPPKKMAQWRAHTQRITSVQFVDHWSTVVTGSTDGSVRLWTIQGQYIGTFGQESEWRLGVPSSYQYPKVLQDVLGDVNDSWSSSKNNAIREDTETLTIAELELHENTLDLIEENLASVPAVQRTSSIRESSPVSTHSMSDKSTRNDELEKIVVKSAPSEINSAKSSRPDKGNIRSSSKQTIYNLKSPRDSVDRNLSVLHIGEGNGTSSSSNIFIKEPPVQVPSTDCPEVGKRLRHLRTHSAIKKDETKSKRVYTKLKFFPLADDEVKITKPVFDRHH